MQQKTNYVGIIVGIVAVAIVVGVAFYVARPAHAPTTQPAQPSPSTSAPSVTPPPPPTTTPVKKTLSDDVITLSYPSPTFALATKSSQITVHSYIPPCGDGADNFTYCLYYNGSSYTGTNFESAGVRIQKRNDLTSEAQCLNTPQAPTHLGTHYTTSNLGTTGDAGAGHVASGEMYRLAYTDVLTGNLICYEFETRVGMTQFANYPAGTVTEFTNANRASLLGTLDGLLSHITLPDDTLVIFPAAPNFPTR